MANRIFGRSVLNEGFGDEVVQAVWNKGAIVHGTNPAVLRKDICGAWIARDDYGNTSETGMGWEIDHIIPVSKGGSDALNNLQPLQWQNNRAKSDNSSGNWTCAVVAKG